MTPHRRTALLALSALPMSACTTPPTPSPAPPRETLVAQLHAAESAFAASMARRDLAAFERFVADDAVFVNGGDPLRGRAAIVAHWQRFFTTPQAPFAWRPDTAEVSGDGTLGYTSGPVSRPDGTVFLRFASTWRRAADGRWQVVFDNGHAVCPPPSVGA